MGFFDTFWMWLNGALGTYIGATVARVAAILEPTLVVLASIYVMGWGVLMLTGRLEEPVTAGLKRIAKLVIVFGIGIHLWLYNTLIVDTFYHAPAQFAAQVIGASSPVRTLDEIWNQGGEVAGRLFDKGSVWRGAVGFYIAGAVVWVLIGLLCVYTMFLLALSSIALSVLLALGPLFIVMWLFEATRSFFVAWISQLANYALITILTVMVAALMLHLVEVYAQQTAALGSAVDTVDALDMLLVTTLVFLFMRQVMPIASGLAGGIALSTQGMMSRTLVYGGRPIRAAARWALPAAAVAAGTFVRQRVTGADARAAARREA